MKKVYVGLAALVSCGLCVQGPTQQGTAGVSEAKLQRLVPEGYARAMTKETDLDGDGLREIVVVIHDKSRNAEDDIPEYERREARGELVPPRLLVLRRGKPDPRLWCEVRLGGTGHEGETIIDLRTVDLSGDGRPELVVSAWPFFYGEEWHGVDVYIYTLRGDSFELIGTIDRDAYELLGHCDLTRAFPGDEILATYLTEADSYEDRRLHVRMYGYHQGKYRVFWEQSRGRYEDAAKGWAPLEALGAKPLRWLPGYLGAPEIDDT